MVSIRRNLRHLLTGKRLLLVVFVMLGLFYISRMNVPRKSNSYDFSGVDRGKLPREVPAVDKSLYVIDEIKTLFENNRPSDVYNLTYSNLTDYSEGRSQILSRYLPRNKNGFFVDYRGGNGEFRSVSLDLEIHGGWNGLVIEPDDLLFAALKKKHRRCNILHACLNTTDDTKDDGGVQAAENKMWGVPCYRFDDILRASGRRDVDLLLLDTRQSEMATLKSISFSANKIKTIMITFHTIVLTEYITIVNDFLRTKNLHIVHQISNSHLGLMELIYVHHN